MSRNSNCLEGRRCPQCQQNVAFNVTATSVFVVTDDGTEHHTDVNYEENSPVQCPSCDWEGKWGETQEKLCMHCQGAIVIRKSDGQWVHVDDDEKPDAEDFGWIFCGGFMAEPDTSEPAPEKLPHITRQPHFSDWQVAQWIHRNGWDGSVSAARTAMDDASTLTPEGKPHK